MFSVFTILKITGESSRVITARNSAAAAVAHAFALASAEANGLRRADEQRYKYSVASDIYQVRFDENEVNTLLSVVHRPTGQIAINIRGSCSRWLFPMAMRHKTTRWCGFRVQSAGHDRAADQPEP